MNRFQSPPVVSVSTEIVIWATTTFVIKFDVAKKETTVFNVKDDVLGSAFQTLIESEWKVSDI